MTDRSDGRPDAVERVAKTLHQLYGPSEIQAWDDLNFDHETWRADARLVLGSLRDQPAPGFIEWITTIST